MIYYEINCESTRCLVQKYSEYLNLVRSDYFTVRIFFVLSFFVFYDLLFNINRNSNSKKMKKR